MGSKPVRALLAAYFIYNIIDKLSNNASPEAPMSSFMSGIAAFIILLSVNYFYNILKKVNEGRFRFNDEWAEMLMWTSMSFFWILRFLDK